MRSLATTLLFLLLALQLTFAKGEVSLYASGEIHGSIQGIEGITKKVTALRQTKDLILVDGGGFSAGGVYDLFTGGTKADSLQTVTLWQKMYEASYDAIAVGDEELQYGAGFIRQQQELFPLPLISANVQLAGGNDKVIAPYAIVKKERKKIAITSVVTQQQILAYGEGVTVTSAKSALDSLLPKLLESVDEVILLAHVGEEVSRMIAQEFPTVKILLNGHKKSSAEPVVYEGGTAILQFGFLGTSLSHVLLTDASVISKKWVPVSIDTTLVIRSNTRDRADLYIMSGCPYAKQAIGELLALMSDMPMELHLWFIGTLAEEGPVPALKTGNLLEEKQWIAIQELYPDRQQDFLWLVVNQDNSIKEAVSTLKFDKTKINAWVQKHGETAIALHYRRSRTLQMGASPILWMNNRKYQGELYADRLLLGACLDGNLEGKVCDTLGSCVSNSDCPDTDSTVGICHKGGRGGACLNRPEPEVTMYTILPRSALWTIDTTFYDENKKLFPSMTFEEISPLNGDSARYTLFLTKTGKRRLPLILMDSSARSAHRFQEVADMFEPCGEYFCLSYDERPDGFYVDRPFHDGEIAVFVDSTVWSDNLITEIRKEYPLYPMGEVPEGATMGLWLNNQELFTVKSFVELQELIKEMKALLDLP